ncbi:hypothetical protein [Haloferax gibbonsii]|uniref:hypothetical protein n=1 Tax=Haloferax gibbonsii TaxID=35746 RepID=UPI0012E2364C|nr:hypothetical protein [Haloferax gibbonsii]
MKRGIEQQANTNLRIATELTDIVEFAVANGYVPNGPAIKTPDLESRCAEATYYRVTRLYDEMGMILKFDQGPSTYLIHTRKDEIVNGQGVSAMVNEELRRIVSHAKQDSTIRQVVANARNVPSGRALQGLFNGNFAERRDRLEWLVNAIQLDPRVTQGNYGKIIFRTPANLYRASPLAVQLYNK